MSRIDEQEELFLQAARLHQVPDWERLMESNITPALVIGGERRLHRRSPAATTNGVIPSREFADSK